MRYQYMGNGNRQVMEQKLGIERWNAKPKGRNCNGTISTNAAHMLRVACLTSLAELNKSQKTREQKNITKFNQNPMTPISKTGRKTSKSNLRTEITQHFRWCDENI